jgi:hypothetical protein
VQRIPSPPTAPIDADTYLEADADSSSERDVIRRMIDGQYSAPRKVVMFNAAEGVSRDVSEDIARAIVAKTNDLPEGTRQFVEFFIGEKVR